MRKILRHMKEYRKESVCAPLFKLLEALFELFVPLVMARIIDIGIANGDRGYIVRMCLVMAALGLIGLICSITAQYLRQRLRSDLQQRCDTNCLHTFRACLFQRWMSVVLQP